MKFTFEPFGIFYDREKRLLAFAVDCRKPWDIIITSWMFLLFFVIWPYACLTRPGYFWGIVVWALVIGGLGLFAHYQQKRQQMQQQPAQADTSSAKAKAAP